MAAEAMEMAAEASSATMALAKTPVVEAERVACPPTHTPRDGRSRSCPGNCCAAHSCRTRRLPHTERPSAHCGSSGCWGCAGIGSLAPAAGTRPGTAGW